MTILSLANQKGGVGKTTATLSLGYALANAGKTILLIDFDPQASLTISLGISYPDTLENTMSELLTKASSGDDYDILDYVVKKDNISFIPSNILLTGVEQNLYNLTSREYLLNDILSEIKEVYDYILIDNGPSLGLLTINSLTAADAIIIPVLSDFLSIKGVELLMQTYKNVTKRLNKRLKIQGILFTQHSSHIRNSKEILCLMEKLVGENINIFSAKIPSSVKMKEASLAQTTIFNYDKSGKIAAAYEAFAKEILEGSKND